MPSPPNPRSSSKPLSIKISDEPFATRAEKQCLESRSPTRFSGVAEISPAFGSLEGKPSQRSPIETRNSETQKLCKLLGPWPQKRVHESCPISPITPAEFGLVEDGVPSAAFFTLKLITTSQAGDGLEFSFTASPATPTSPKPQTAVLDSKVYLYPPKREHPKLSIQTNLLPLGRPLHVDNDMLPSGGNLSPSKRVSLFTGPEFVGHTLEDSELGN